MPLKYCESLKKLFELLALKKLSKFEYTYLLHHFLGTPDFSKSCA